MKGLIMIVVSGLALGVMLAILVASLVFGWANLSVGLFFATIIAFGWVDEKFSEWREKK